MTISELPEVTLNYTHHKPDDPWWRYYDVECPEGNKIGSTAIHFFTEGVKILVDPTIAEVYRNQKLGLALYVTAAKLEDPDGGNSVLCSDEFFLNEDSERVWESLIRRGMVKRDEHGLLKTARFIQ